MVKKKQAENSPALEPEPEPPIDPATQLQDFINEIKTGFKTIETNFQDIEKRFQQQDAKIAAVAKTSDRKDEQAEKGTNPMDIMKTIEGLLNSPIVNKIAESLIGGSEPAQQAVAPAVDAKYINMLEKEHEETVSLSREWMKAMIKGAELKNKAFELEMGSDVHMGETQ